MKNLSYRNKNINALWIVLLAIILVKTATGNEKTIQALKIEETINIDGQLNETSWVRAQPADDFIQQSPDEGQPITERTEVRVLYDTQKLYIGFECYDSQPGKVVANEMRRDGELWQNDNVYVLLDTYGDKRRGFFFRTNALGAQADSTVTDGGQNINGSWDCIWECAGQRHKNGWTVELAIPFNQLRFKESEEMVWGINFGRNIMRTNESAQWVQVPINESWPGTYHPTYQGKLLGLKGIHSPAHLDFKPYLLGGVSESFEDEDWDRDADGDTGLDVKYGVTSNLTLDLTVNTDFAQVEADREEVNLTRFSLYFPEKREFFLEGQGLFACGAGFGGWGPPPLSIFYSRRIGIEEDKQVPILGGAKLTGKVGSYSVGALNILTQKTDVSPRTNFSVVRIQRDILNSSCLGFIMTNRQSGLDSDYHRNGGIDLSLRPQDQWKIKAMVAGSWSPNENERGLAWYLSNDWRNDIFRLDMSYLDIGPDFTAEMGFVRRTNIRSFNMDTGLELRPNSHGIRSIGIDLRGDYLLDHDNALLGWESTFHSGMYLDSGEGFGFDIERNFDRVDEPFEIEDSEIPAGDYKMIRLGAGGGTSESRPFSIFGDGSYGDYFNGKRFGFDLDGRWRATYQLAIEMRYGYNYIDLPENNFATNVVGTRISYSLNTRFFTKVFAQWNDTRDRASMNFLLHYIYRPGSDFYLVYDHVWDTSDEFNTRVWTILGKLTYLSF